MSNSNSIFKLVTEIHQATNYNYYKTFLQIQLILLIC